MTLPLTNSPKDDRYFYEKIYVGWTYLPVGLSNFFLLQGSTLIHELGHLLARSLIHPKRECTLLIDWSKGAYITRCPEGKEREESTFDKETDLGLVALSGPLASLKTMALSSIAAWRLRHSHPRTALALALNATVIGINDTVNTLFPHFNDDYELVEQNLKIPRQIQALVTGGAALGATCLLIKVTHSIYKEEMEKLAYRFNYKQV